MEKENNKAWEMLLEALEGQKNEIVRLQQREIDLLKTIMELEEKTRSLISVISSEKFKDVEEVND